MWIALLCLVAAAPSVDDARSSLVALSAPSLDERAAAERWLSRNLKVDDYAVVAEFVAGADVEARVRLAQALGANDAHVELAALLSADEAPAARRVGDSALRQRVRAWSGAPQLKAVSGGELWEKLEGRFEGVFALDAGAPGEALERLARHAPPMLREGGGALELFVAIDPPAMEALARAAAAGDRNSPRASSWSEGSFEELLRSTCADHRFSVDAFGLDGGRPWLWIHATPADGDLDGADLLRHWCRSFVLGRERTRGESAARALAQSGWPAPLSWLARQWTERGDRNALAGVLAAASRGRIAPELLHAREVAKLLAEFEGRAAQPGADFESFRREFTLALQRFPPLDVEGAPLWELVATWGAAETASDARRLCARHVLAGMRRAPDGVSEKLRSELAAAQPAHEKFVALKLAAAIARGEMAPTSIAVTPEWLEQMLAQRTDALVLEWSERIAATPSITAGADARIRTLPPRSRALMIDWLLRHESGEARAAEQVRVWLSEDAPFVELAMRLRACVERGETSRIERCLASASQGASAERAKRLRVLACVSPMLERQKVFEEVSSTTPIPASDWPLLGAIARKGASPTYSEFVLEHAVRIAQVDKAVDAPWVAAFADAYAGTSARGETALAERMRRELRAALRRAGHPLHAAMEQERWPKPPGPAPIALDALEAHL